MADLGFKLMERTGLVSYGLSITTCSDLFIIVYVHVMCSSVKACYFYELEEGQHNLKIFFPLYGGCFWN